MPFAGEDDIYRDAHLDPQDYADMGADFRSL